MAPQPFALRWTHSDWQEFADVRSRETALGFEFVDLAIPPEQRSPIRFTFHWLEGERWEGRDYEVLVEYS
jgi:glucoamylase